MKRLFKWVLLICFLFSGSAVFGEEIQAVPEVTVEFGDYGLSVCSENQNYLNSMESISMYWSYFDQVVDVSFDKNQWIIKENELFLPCAEYMKAGVERNTHQSITLSSTGYEQKIVSSYYDGGYASDLKLLMNRHGDIVISSSDEYWLSELVSNENDHVISVQYNPHLHLCYFSTSDFVIKDGQVVIPYEVQLKKNICPGIEYLFRVSFVNDYRMQDMGSLVITHGRSDADYGSLMTVPEYTAEFTEDGFIVISDDLDYLNSIDKIMFVTTDYEVLHEAEMSSEDWKIEGNELLVPGSAYFKQGVPNKVDVVISSKGYLDSCTVVYDSVIRNRIKDAKLLMNESGDILIQSSNEYWMQKVVETENEKAIWLFSTPSTVTGYVPNTALKLQDGKIVFSSVQQRKLGMLNGKNYGLEIQSVPGYHETDLGEVTLTHGLDPYPSDVKFEIINQQIVFSSSDQNWLDHVLMSQQEQGIASLIMTSLSQKKYEFYNDGERQDLMVKDNQLILDFDVLKHYDIPSDSYFFSVNSAYHETFKTHTARVVQPYVMPKDIQIQVNETTGSIEVISNDQDWLKSLCDLRDEYAAVYLSSHEKESWFWNTDQETDLIYEQDRVIITKEPQRRRELYQNETYEFIFYSEYYGESDVYEVTIGNGGYKKRTDDVLVYQDESGNLVIETQDTQYLDVLLSSGIQLISPDYTIKWTFTEGIVPNETQLILPYQILIDEGVSNGTYTVKLITDEYLEIEIFCELTNMKQMIDFDIQVIFDEQMGIIISSDYQEYIASIVNVYVNHAQTQASYLYNDIQARREEGQYVIPIDEMRKDGVISADYHVFVYSDTYQLKPFELTVASAAFDENEIVRLKGKTRYETSLKIADAFQETLNAEKFEAVILANGRDFADALSGSVLAIAEKAPILLVDSKNNKLDQIMEYLNQHLMTSGKVYILGGEAAVPAFVEQALIQNGIAYERIKGKNRYETNLEILKKANVSSDTILIASGKNFADSLSASAAGIPMMLVGNQLNESQIKYLNDHPGKHFVILGGSAAVSESIHQQLTQWGTAERIYGKTRYETSVEIAKRFYPEADTMILAYAKNYPDGLCGGPLAYFMQAPLILTAENNNTAAVFNSTMQFRRGAVLGGETLISDEAVFSIFYKYPIIK